MEKAILKTLIYADIFDYPLTTYEIHKWLIGKKTTLRQIEKALQRLSQASRIRYQKGYYFLPRGQQLIAKRQRRHRQSVSYFRKAKLLTAILKVIPWIKLVGISGGLAMDNAQKKDDIDLIIVTSKNRLWTARLLALGLLSLTGQRRKVGQSGKKIAGKLCLNILLEEDRLDQKKRDIYLAHEVLQMRVLWQRDGIYAEYLSDNAWVFKFLPNWTTNLSSQPRVIAQTNHWIPAFAGMTMEQMAKWFQIKIMKKPIGQERIQDGALYFHPNDIRLQVLADYRSRIKNIF